MFLCFYFHVTLLQITDELRSGFRNQISAHFQIQICDFGFLNSSDELYAYLSHHRPDLCILEGGGEEEEAEKDEDDFVILSEGEEEGEEAGRDGRTGDEWEVCISV